MPRLGVRVGHRVVDVEAASRVDGEPLPATLKGLLREGRLQRVREKARAIVRGDDDGEAHHGQNPQPCMKRFITRTHTGSR